MTLYCHQSAISSYKIAINLISIKPMPPKWYNDRLSHLIILFVWIISVGTASMSMFVSGMKRKSEKNYACHRKHEVKCWPCCRVNSETIVYFKQVVIKNENSIQDRKINRTNVTNSLCVASFTPEMTFISTMVSFVIPGIAIVIANIGMFQSFYL